MSETSAGSARLTLRTRLAYGLPNFGLALVGVPILVYLPKFYSDVVGVPVAWLGFAYVAGRVLDAVTDPLVGLLSDRSRAAAGRRRPWIVWGSLPLELLTVAIYVPPASLGDTAVVAWAAAVIVGWFLAFTAVGVPYRALGPELTDDYDERTALFSIRESLLVVGTLFAAVGPGLIALALGLSDGEDERTKFAWYVAVTAPILVLTCVVCGRGVQERFATEAGPPTSTAGLVAQVRQALANRPFVILLTAFVVIALGSGLPAVLLTYFARYVLHSELVPLYMLVYYGVGLSCMPGWVRLSRRWGKKRTWLTAMAVNAGFFAFVAFVGDGQELAYGLLVAGSGIGAVAVLAMPYAMQADVIDRDEMLTGQRREGLYGGLWSIAEKTAAGLGVGLSLLALDWAGYTPNVEQEPYVLDVLRALYIGVPCLSIAAGFVIALRYPLDRTAHQAIASQLQRGRGQGDADDIGERNESEPRADDERGSASDDASQ